MQETTTLFEKLIFPQLDYPLLFEQFEAKNNELFSRIFI